MNKLLVAMWFLIGGFVNIGVFKYIEQLAGQQLSLIYFFGLIVLCLGLWLGAITKED